MASHGAHRPGWVAPLSGAQAERASRRGGERKSSCAWLPAGRFDGPGGLRFSVQEGIPEGRLLEPLEQLRRVPPKDPANLGVELTTGPIGRNLERRLHPTCATVELDGICGVAGLGGNPYRDGSFEYYLSEPIVPDDPKGVSALLLAVAEAVRRAPPAPAA